MAKKNSVSFDLTVASIIRILAVLLALIFLWFIRDIVGILFVSIIFASAFNPWVDAWQKRKIPRGLTIIIIYILIISAFSLAIYLVAGPIIDELMSLANNFPLYYNEIVGTWNRLQSLGGGLLSEYDLRGNINTINLPNATASLLVFIRGLFGSIVAFLLVLVMTFYLTVGEKNTRQIIKGITPPAWQSRAMQIMSLIQNKLGQWLRGQFLLSVIIFVMTYTGLSILGVRYALILSLLAGVLEVVPYLGPIIAAVPAIFLAFQQSPQIGIAVLVLYFLIQQLENNLIVPKVMGRIVGLSPVIILVAMLIGAKIGGLVGALIAVPVVTALSVVVSEFSGNNKGAAEDENE